MHVGLRLARRRPTVPSRRGSVRHPAPEARGLPAIRWWPCQMPRMRSPPTTPCCCSFGGPEAPDEVLPFLARSPPAGHPRRAARGGRRALLRRRRPQPDQRPEPRAARAPCAPSSTGAASTRRCSGATATGRRSSPTRCARRSTLGAARVRHPDHQRVLVLLLVPAVPRGPRGRRDAVGPAADGRRRSTRCAPTPSTPGSSAVAGCARSSRRCGALPDPASAPCCSSPTRCPTRWTTLRAGDGEGPLLRPAPRLARRAHRRLAASSGRELDRDWSTARGPARRQPWLEPDVNDRIEELARRGRADRGRGPDRLRLRPHGGRARPRHRGGRDGRAARAAVRAGADARAPTTCSSTGLVDLLARAGRRGPRRGGRPRRPGCAGDVRPAVCAAGCCPNLRAGPPAAVRQRLMAAAPGAARRCRLAELEAVACRGRPRPPARLVVDERPGRSRSPSTKSTDTDVVTAMDQRSQELILPAAHRRRAPTTRSSARRAASAAGTSGLTWVVDPIDGTVNYLYGIPAYACRSRSSPATRDPAGPRSWPARAQPGVRRPVHRAPRAGAPLPDGRPIADAAAPVPPTWAGPGRHRLRVRRADPAPRAGRSARRPAAAGPRHPPDRERGARPLRARLRPAGRVLRARAESVGPRGRWAESPARPGRSLGGR